MPYLKELEVSLEGRLLEQVTKFVYLGGLITEDGKCIRRPSREGSA